MRNYITVSQSVRPTCRIRTAFTLIELLVVIAIIYLLAAILIGLSFLFKTTPMTSWFYKSGFAFYILGLGTSLYGFVMRCLIAGRPPV